MFFDSVSVLDLKTLSWTEIKEKKEEKEELIKKIPIGRIATSMSYDKVLNVLCVFGGCSMEKDSGDVFVIDLN